MFSNKDYISYFEEIKKIEELMMARAKILSQHLGSDEVADKLIEHWLRDEQKHRKICQKNQKLIQSKYQ